MSQIRCPIVAVPNGDVSREGELFQVKVVERDIVMSRLDEIGETVRHGGYRHKTFATEWIESEERGRRRWSGGGRGLLRVASLSRRSRAAASERQRQKLRKHRVVWR